MTRQTTGDIETDGEAVSVTRDRSLHSLLMGNQDLNEESEFLHKTANDLNAAPVVPIPPRAKPTHYQNVRPTEQSDGDSYFNNTVFRADVQSGYSGIWSDNIYRRAVEQSDGDFLCRSAVRTSPNISSSCIRTFNKDISNYVFDSQHKMLSREAPLSHSFGHTNIGHLANRQACDRWSKNIHSLVDETACLTLGSETANERTNATSEVTSDTTPGHSSTTIRSNGVKCINSNLNGTKNQYIGGQNITRLSFNDDVAKSSGRTDHNFDNIYYNRNVTRSGLSRPSPKPNESENCNQTVTGSGHSRTNLERDETEVFSSCWDNTYQTVDSSRTTHESLNNSDSKFHGLSNVTTTNTQMTISNPHISTQPHSNRKSDDNYKRPVVFVKTNLQHNKWHNFNSSNHIEDELLKTYDIALFFKPDSDGDSYASLAIIHFREDIILKILQRVTDQNLLSLPNNDGNTLLHLATILDMPNIVRHLVVMGAEITSQNSHGNTPLHVASIKGHLKCAKALTRPIEHDEVRARPYYTPYQRIPQKQDVLNYDGFACLHLAAQHGNIDIVDHLLYECGADVNIQDGTSGMTILHYAAIENNCALVSFLLAIRRIDVNAMRYDSATPLAIARGRKNDEVSHLLQNNQAIDYDHTDEESDESDDDDDVDMVLNSNTWDRFTQNNTYDDIQIRI